MAKKDVKKEEGAEGMLEATSDTPVSKFAFGLPQVSADFGREDLNLLRDVVNELSRRA